ncbi:MAG: hypothetical protein K6U89_19565 [Chloroflexi bacterium]|nr:hypothetical protein [Chloroflexota bacterium]
MSKRSWWRAATISALMLAFSLDPGAARPSHNGTEAPTDIPAYQPVDTPRNGTVESASTLQMLGIPLGPTTRFPRGARAAVFTLPALSDPQFVPRLRQYLASGGRALITQRLAARLGQLPSLYADRVYILRLPAPDGAVDSLPQSTVDEARNFLLSPLGLNIQAPPRVRFRLLGNHQIQVENCNPWAAGVKISFRPGRWPRARVLESEGAMVPLQVNLAAFQIPPHTRRVFRLVRG